MSSQGNPSPLGQQPKPEMTLAEKLKAQRAKKSNIKRRKDGTIQQLPVSMNLNDPEEMRKKMAGNQKVDHATLQEDLIKRTKTAIKALQETTRKENIPETV